MASSGNDDNNKKDKQQEEGEGGGGFMDKVKGFIQDVGEKIEETIGVGKPTADVQAVHLPHIGLNEAELVVDVLVSNPNPVPIPLADLNYVVESDGRKLVSGLIPDAGTLQAHGSVTINIPLKIVFEDIKKAYADIKEGTVIPYKVRVELICDVPVIGKITIPLEKSGEIPVPYKPEVDLEKVQFDDFSFEETKATLHVKMVNKNDFDMGLNALEYHVWLGDDKIGGAKMDKSAKIGKNGEGKLEVPVTFRPKDFGSAMWDMMRGRGISYTMKGSVEVDSVFGPMKLPFCREGGSTKLRQADDNDDDEE